MVWQETTFHTDETITKMFLNDAQLVADREEAIAIGSEGCNGCVVAGHLTTWGEFVINCAARSFSTLEAASEQEGVCRQVHRDVLKSISGQTEVYLRDA